VEAQIVNTRLASIQARGGPGITAPAETLRVDAIEVMFLRILEAEIPAEQFRTFAQVDDAAVRLEIAAHAGEKAVAEIDVAGNALIGRRRRSRRFRPLGLRRCFRRRFSGLCIRLRLSLRSAGFRLLLLRLLRRQTEPYQECQ